MAYTVLAQAVVDRISSTRLIQLTNPDDTVATTISETKINAAATDTESEFKLKTGVAFDGTNADHIKGAIKGVLIQLMKWSSRENNMLDKIVGEWNSELKRIRETIGGGTRLSPTTLSELTPTPDKKAGDTSTVRPDLDKSAFDNLRPKPPFGGG